MGSVLAIYNKFGRKVLNDSISVDGDCYFGDRPIKIRALLEGRTHPQLIYISDLIADDGKEEIQAVIKANRRKQR